MEVEKEVEMLFPDLKITRERGIWRLQGTVASMGRIVTFSERISAADDALIELDHQPQYVVDITAKKYV